MKLSEYIEIEQFSLSKEEKGKLLASFLEELHSYHLLNSPEYKSITDALFSGIKKIEKIEDLPFIPVSLFKNKLLKSIPEEDVYKILTSSGTTGSVPSRIVLDQDTARMQTIALSKIINHVIGKERLPMLIIDSKAVIKDRTSFSARGAGILGLSVFGKNHQYLLDENYHFDYDGLIDFLAKFNGQRILIFGFTFMVWQYLYNLDEKYKMDLSKSILIHSGGWKKLEEIAVDNNTFRSSFKTKYGLENIYNFYGMVEQVGSIFIENSEGYLHCPNFSDIIIRNPYDFSVQPHGTEGLIQVVSMLPKSYPGHSILTEDIGVCMGEDHAGNGWKGKYFKILGRAKKADLRGCSDTFVAGK